MQLTFVQMYGMLHSLNHSVAHAVLQMRPLAKAAEAHCTVPRPLAIEAPIADHEAPAFRPLVIIDAEVSGTVIGVSIARGLGTVHVSSAAITTRGLSAWAS